ncbi:uncharacterized protein [Aegilops tauschii subsp. strangulata]|uniref:uncharacterized protein n=1 Tax=Aegilops tauschii subsp. strangulata TaxID=200361 RepID=UPI003CC89D18
MSRTWIDHPMPSLLLLQGNIIRDQIIGKEATSHECMTLILRRLAQIERKNSTNGDDAISRKFMEPDFTTLVIRNIDPMFVVSVQTELLMEKHIDQCRMFIFHTTLQYGWCCYILDMLKKRIVVLDPQAGPFGFTTDRVKFHEQVSHAPWGILQMCRIFLLKLALHIYWMDKRVPYIDDRKNPK